MAIKDEVCIPANPYPFIVGIDFRSISVAHKKDPSNIFTVISCKKPSCISCFDTADEEMGVLCNILEPSTDLVTNNVHPCKLNQYLSNIDQANQELSKISIGLNLETVIVSYLKYASIMVKSLHSNETFTKAKYYKDFKFENIHYYISCAQPELLSACFIKAGLVKDTEQHRLTFVPGFGPHDKKNQENIAVSSYTSLLFGLNINSVTLIQDIKPRGITRKVEEPIDFIVGIDFGTTFSGCSYARLNSVPKVIKTVKQDSLKETIEKFATAILYEEDSLEIEPKYWGQEAKDKYQFGRDDLLYLDKFKLFMLPDTYMNAKQPVIDAFNYGNSSINDSSIDIVQVIADYFKFFTKYIAEDINDKEEDLRRTSLDKAIRVLKLEKKFNLKYILTVPDAWDEKSKEILMEAAEMAKIKDLHQGSVITELRSGALYYGDLIKDNFIVCDAGGATVNVGTYRLENLKDGSRNLIQIGSDESDTCGSMYLDENFQDYIYQFYKDIGVHLDKSLYKSDSALAYFVRHIKPNFIPDNTSDNYYNVNLPVTLSISDYITPENTKKYRLINSNRTLRIKHRTLDNEVFDPIFKRIERLLDNQLLKKNICEIVLVGGLSQSKYLQKRLKDKYGSKVQLTIPVDYNSAVSRGAVLYGLDPTKVHFSCI